MARRWKKPRTERGRRCRAQLLDAFTFAIDPWEIMPARPKHYAAGELMRAYFQVLGRRSAKARRREAARARPLKRNRPRKRNTGDQAKKEGLGLAGRLDASALMEAYRAILSKAGRRSNTDWRLAAYILKLAVKLALCDRIEKSHLGTHLLDALLARPFTETGEVALRKSR